MKKYSKIVVLSAGITENPKGPRKFADGKNNFNYEVLVDPYEFRFKAVKKLFQDGLCSEFVLVGGEVETMNGGIKSKFIGSDGKTVEKAEVMRYSLVNDYQIPGNNFPAVLKSISNTRGNAEAVLRYFKENNVTNFDDIGVLTSFYHLPRSIKIFKEAGLSLMPICAESVVYDQEFDLIREFYQKEGFSRILSEVEDTDSEIKGMGDQEKGSYNSRFN